MMGVTERFCIVTGRLPWIVQIFCISFVDCQIYTIINFICVVSSEFEGNIYF